MSQDLSNTLARELTLPLGGEYDPDELLRSLKDYATKLGDISLSTEKEIPSLPNELSEIITQISKFTKVIFPWRYLYPVVIVKLREVLSSFDAVSDESQEEERTIINNIDKLFFQRFKDAPPFTIQRICDLLSEPKKFYKTKLKYLHAIDKVLTVISHAKVYCLSPPVSLSSDSKFSPPAKRLKHELSTASTIIVSSDSTSSNDRNLTDHSLHFFNEEISKPEYSIVCKIPEKTLDNSPPLSEQYLECSVSEADSTTLNGVRTIQDSNETRDGNEAKSEEQTATQNEEISHLEPEAVKKDNLIETTHND